MNTISYKQWKPPWVYCSHEEKELRICYGITYVFYDKLSLKTPVRGRSDDKSIVFHGVSLSLQGL